MSAARTGGCQLPAWGGCQLPTQGVVSCLRGGDVSHPHRGVSTARVGEGCRLPTCGCVGRPHGGIGGPWREDKFIDPSVAKIEFGKAGEVEDITTKVKGIASCEIAPPY